MVIDALAQCTGFEWDTNNSDKIAAKHAVTPTECEQVFFNVPIIVGDDVKHSERRIGSTSLVKPMRADYFFWSSRSAQKRRE